MGLLSWLTGRSRAPAPPSPPPAPAPTPRPGAGGGGGELAPIRPAWPARELRVAPAGFARSLGTGQTPLAAGRLGHQVSADAPAGVGHGLVTAEPLTASRSPDPALSVARLPEAAP